MSRKYLKIFYTEKDCYLVVKFMVKYIYCYFQLISLFRFLNSVFVSKLELYYKSVQSMFVCLFLFSPEFAKLNEVQPNARIVFRCEQYGLGFFSQGLNDRRFVFLNSTEFTLCTLFSQLFRVRVVFSRHPFHKKCFF